jgi:hypothetical protein
MKVSIALATVLLLSSGVVSCVGEPVETETRVLTPPPDHYQNGLEAGMVAAESAQTAQTPDQWKEVQSNWSTAIGKLKVVPTDSPDYQNAQAKIQEYERNRDYARQQASEEDSTPVPPTTNVPPVETSLQRFEKAVREADAEGTLIASIRESAQSKDMLEIVVTQNWYSLPQGTQADIAVSLRDKWKQECNCTVPILVFGSEAGRVLLTISAGQPRFKN